MDNSAHNTPKYPLSLVLRTCPEVKYLYTQGIPSVMCPRVEAQKGDTDIHHTAVIVQKAKSHFIERQGGHSCTPQPQLEPGAIFSSRLDGIVARMLALPAGKPHQNYQTSTHTLQNILKMQVSVVFQ
jgi:hypothetical protein